MTETRFQRAIDLAAHADEAFQWHVRPGALRRLLPPWDRARVTGGSGPTERLREGARTTIRIGAGPIGVDWVAEITRLDPAAREFVDEQISGPFAAWRHRHAIEERGAGSQLVDDISYALPMGALGRAVAGGMVRRKLERMFAWRHRITDHDLRAHAIARASGFEARTIAITGASGLVGSSLAAFLRTGGHTVLELVRREPRAEHEVRWDPAAGEVDHASLEGIDALVHLAGESIFGLRWTEDKKRRIADSRVQGTRAIAQATHRMARPPKVCVFASAIGFYGDRGDDVLTEDAARGDGFLADTCAAWEDEARGVAEGVREVRTRLGVVLDPGGGALRTMLPAFRLGVGGRLGGGAQWFPWVALDDVIGAMHFAMHREDVEGPVNLVAPGEVTNAGFTRALGRTLRRPTVLPVPKPALSLAIGAEQAREMLLASVRVRPERLLSLGYGFAHPELGPALSHALGRLV